LRESYSFGSCRGLAIGLNGTEEGLWAGGVFRYVTVVSIDLVVVLCLALVVAAMWFLPVSAMFPVQMGMFGLLFFAALMQISQQRGYLPSASSALLLLGCLLVFAGVARKRATRRQRTRLRATGRYHEVNWRDVQAVALWLAGGSAVVAAVHPALVILLIAGVVGWVWFVLRPQRREIRTHVAVEIRCTPAEAFAVVGDPRQFGRYVEDLEVDAPADREVGVGYRYHFRLRRPHGYVYEGDEEILAYQPGRLIKEHVIGRPRSVGTCTVELAPGGTRVVYDYEGLISVPQALLGLRDATVISTTAARQLVWQRLKALLEVPPDSAASIEPAS
jgi:uncharacterized protein YndB with AHSA1/START domain